MALAELELSEQRITKRELQPVPALTDFEVTIYDSLSLFPTEANTIDFNGKAFKELVRKKFPLTLFTEEDDFTAAAKMTEDLDFENSWPIEISQEQMEGGSKAFTNFCLQVVPILEMSYPSVHNSDPYTIGHRMMTSSIISYSKLREKNHFDPLPLHKRTTMYYEMCDALIQQEKKSNDDPNTLNTTGKVTTLFTA